MALDGIVCLPDIKAGSNAWCVCISLASLVACKPLPASRSTACFAWQVQCDRVCTAGHRGASVAGLVAEHHDQVCPSTAVLRVVAIHHTLSPVPYAGAWKTHSTARHPPVT